MSHRRSEKTASTVKHTAGAVACHPLDRAVFSAFALASPAVSCSLRCPSLAHGGCSSPPVSSGVTATLHLRLILGHRDDGTDESSSSHQVSAAQETPSTAASAHVRQGCNPGAPSSEAADQLCGWAQLLRDGSRHLGATPSGEVQRYTMIKELGRCVLIRGRCCKCLS